MRVVSWNCAGGFAKKAHLLEALQPDILVVQEISRKHAESTDWPYAHWLGPEHTWKGVAVFTRDRSRIHSSCTSEIPWFLPVVIGRTRILCVWATTTGQHSRRYVRLAHEALDHYSEFIHHPRSLLIGDFNSNTVFDGKHALLTHTALVEKLGGRGFRSLYHSSTGAVHGEELDPTFWLYRSEAHPYHLDYAFASRSLVKRSTFSLGPKDVFLGPSDHVPLIVDVL